MNPETFAICKSDLFIKSRDGRDAENIRFDSTLEEDLFRGRDFDYLIANPPYGKDWKRDRQAVEKMTRGGDDSRELGEPAVAYVVEKKSPGEVKVILGQLRCGLEGLYYDRLRGIYLFRSYARDEAAAGSDIDVLIILNRVESSWDEIKRTSHLRAELSLEYDISLGTLWVSQGDWEKGDTPLLETVRREGVPV